MLTTSHTGSRDAIIDNETGLYIELSVDSIKNTLEKLINNTDLAFKLGKQGRNYVSQNFGQHLIWDEIESHIYCS